MVKIRRERKVGMVKLLTALSLTLDFAREGLLQHHRRVAYMALRLARALGMSSHQRRELFMAAMLHDAGAVTFKEKDELLRFDVENTWSHCHAGAEFARRSKVLAPLAPLILGHHDRWQGPNRTGWSGSDIPLPCRIIHLVDRVDVLLHGRTEGLAAREEIYRRLAEMSKHLFDPELVSAFREASAPESFWLDVVSPFLERVLAEEAEDLDFSLGWEELASTAEFFASVIDAKSRFTQLHSRRVAEVAARLATRLGMSPEERELLRLAGLLHDLGKVSVPEEILEKPGKLTPSEFERIKAHTFYTYRLLETAGDLSPLIQWAAYHHERLDGTGYPFRIASERLDLGARLTAVADIFVALREDRPYRAGLSRDEIAGILRGQAAGGALDAAVVEVALSAYEELEEAVSSFGPRPGDPT